MNRDFFIIEILHVEASAVKGLHGPDMVRM